MPLFFAGKAINGITLGIYAAVSVAYISEAHLSLRYMPYSMLTICSDCAAGFARNDDSTCCISLCLRSIHCHSDRQLDGTESSRWAYQAFFCSQYGVALIATIAWPFMPEDLVYPRCHLVIFSPPPAERRQRQPCRYLVAKTSLNVAMCPKTDVDKKVLKSCQVFVWQRSLPCIMIAVGL